MKRNWTFPLLVAAALPLAACTVEKTEEGEAPKVDVDVEAGKLPEYDKLLTGQPIWQARTKGVGHLDVAGCIALGVTGPLLRSAGVNFD